MSYINDALRKAQQEKDGRYSRYSGVISRLPGPRGRRRAGWIVAAASITLMLAAFVVWWAAADRQERSVAGKQQATEKVIAAAQMRAPTSGTTQVEQAPAPVQMSGGDQAASRSAAAAAGPVKPDASGTDPARLAETTRAQGEGASTTATGPVPAASAATARTIGVKETASSMQAKAGGDQAPLRQEAQRQPKAPGTRTAKSPGLKGAAPARPTAAKLAPTPESLYQEALSAQRNKKTAAAERLYRRILTLDAAHTGAMNNLGVLYMSRGQYDQALVLFKKAIAARKDYVDPHYNLACLYAQRGDYASSIAYLKSAVAINRAAVEWARTDKDLKPLRGMDDFKKLLEGGE
jgi:Flp pilus assembly protein TadD